MLFGRDMAAFQLGVEEEARIWALLGAIFGLVACAVAGAVRRAGWWAWSWRRRWPAPGARLVSVPAGAALTPGITRAPIQDA
jgi:hypothetical protein